MIRFLKRLCVAIVLLLIPVLIFFALIYVLVVWIATGRDTINDPPNALYALVAWANR